MIANNELISVVVPIYRVEEYIHRCVDSILGQTYKNIEIILVDDGSDDNCPLICDDYQKKDNRIIVIHKPNGGLSDARNAGIRVANGKYITFVDSDDYLDDDYVEFLYDTIKKEDSDISICSYTAIYDTGARLTQASSKKMILQSKETIKKMLYQEDFNVSTWAKMYKLELFNDVEFPVGRIFEDACTTYKLVLKCKKISCNMESKYNYMIRSNSILTANFSMRKLTLVNAYDEMGADVLKVYPDLNNAVIRGMFYSRISTLRQMIDAKPRLREIEKEYRKFALKNMKTLFKDKRVSKRDKISILTLIPGVWLFKFMWKVYCKKTGRSI